MLSAQQVWLRVKRLKAFASLSEFDFRPVYYVQKFAPAVAVAGVPVPTGFVAQDFPNGAIIIGITACCFTLSEGTAQGTKNRQLFGLDFQFSNTDAIVVGGPVQADALLGGGEGSSFPAREIIIAPGNKVNCRVENYTPGAMNIHVTYHALAYRTTS